MAIVAAVFLLFSFKNYWLHQEVFQDNFIREHQLMAKTIDYSHFLGPHLLYLDLLSCWEQIGLVLTSARQTGGVRLMVSQPYW